MSLPQVQAIVFYETRMLWRRRVLPTLMLLCVLLLTTSSYALVQQMRDMTVSEERTAELTRMGVDAAMSLLFGNTTLVMFSLMSTLLVFFIVIPPLALAEAIPYDSQYRLRDLLDSLPLGQGTYLLGKVGGTWGGLLLGFFFVSALTGGLLRWLIGPYALGGYALMWLVLLPLALFASACTVLLSAGQPSRRRAIFVGALIMTYLLYSYTTSNEQATTLAELMRPVQAEAYMTIQQIYTFNMAPAAFQEEIVAFTPSMPPAMPPFSLMFTLQAAQLLLLGLLVWGWRSWRSSRR